MTTRRISVVLILLMAGASGCGPGGSSPQAGGAASTLTLTDPPESVPLKSGNSPGLDVETVRLESDGSLLRVRVQFNEDVLTILKAQGMGVCGAELSLDIDGDDKTGGLAWENPEMGGFEIHLRILTGVKYAGGGTMVEGGLKGKEVSEGFATYRLFRCNTGEPVFDARMRHMKDRSPAEQKAEAEVHDRASRIEGREVAVDVPYSELGAKPGRKIRVLVRETHAAGRAQDIFLPQGFLTLR